MSRCRPLQRLAYCAGRPFGFAYLWLLFVVVFVGLGLSLGAEFYTTGQQRDKERELLAMGRQFRQAIARYYETQSSANAATPRQYPASLEELLQDPRSAGIQRHLRQVFVDPMTGKAEWGLLKIAGRIVGVHSLSDKLPIKQDGFEADDAGFRGSERYSDWVFSYPADLSTRLTAPAGAASSPAPVAPINGTPAVPAASSPGAVAPPAVDKPPP